MATIVIVGAGVGGVSQAFELKPPRNTNWASKGKWVHFAKIAFEKYFLHKVRHGKNEPFYEKQILKWIGADKLKDTR